MPSKKLSQKNQSDKHASRKRVDEILSTFSMYHPISIPQDLQTIPVNNYLFRENICVVKPDCTEQHRRNSIRVF
jgi:hypothetical protein